MIIFAYGSNMNLNRLQERVPSAVKISNAYLNSFELKCNKVSRDLSAKANIVLSNNPNDVVWGVLFEVDDNEKPDLDSAEGLGNGYNEMIISVTDAQNEVRQAQVYIADENSINDNLLPYDWYREFILSGAEQNALPQDYINRLSALNSQVDNDVNRRNINFNILRG